MDSIIQKKDDLVKENSLSDQKKWEYLKYKVRNFTIAFSKGLAKNSRKLQKEFEQKITTLEQGLSNEKRFDQYMNTKNELLKFYEKNADGVSIWRTIY